MLQASSLVPSPISFPVLRPIALDVASEFISPLTHQLRNFAAGCISSCARDHRMLQAISLVPSPISFAVLRPVALDVASEFISPLTHQLRSFAAGCISSCTRDRRMLQASSLVPSPISFAVLQPTA